MKTFFSIFFLSSSLISGLLAQPASCYVRLEDASGYTPTSEQLAELEAASCALIDSFPAEFRDSFRVYDFGFYLHQEVTEGRYPEPFAQKIQEVQALTPYYLLFGKQTDRQKGIYTHFWVKTKLPSDNLLSCITPAKERLFEADISQAVNNKYIQIKQDYNLYHKAEIAGIINLNNIVDSIIKGNCCPITSNQIKSILLTKGYQVVPAKFIEIPIGAKVQKKQNQNLVEDYAELLCEIQGVSGYEDFSISIEEEINKATTSGIAAAGYITKNENLCENIGEQIMTGFENSGDDALIHIHFSPSQDSSKPGEMFVKFKQINIQEEDLPEVVITAPYNECGPFPLPPTDQSIQTYAVTKESDIYFGYHLLNNNWIRGDTVEFYRRVPFGAFERENTWNDQGAWREDLGPGFGYSYHPSFLAWWWSEMPFAEILNPTVVLEQHFHFFFHKGTYRSEKTKVFQQFKYPTQYTAESIENGTALQWKCDSRLGRGLRELDITQNEFDKIENVISNWLSSHSNLDSIFAGGGHFIDSTGNIYFESPSSSLWAAQIFGGTQGRKIQIKKFKKLHPPSLGMFSNGYEIEFVFTVFDNFGVGQSDGSKWFFPGVIEQWVLQHYRNYDCDKPPCFVPITNHTVEIFHRSWLWISN